jgi:hypothetical protein
MTKYRIVSRPNYIDPSISVYTAQYKFLNLFWVDCAVDVYYPGSYRSTSIERVEEFVDAIINKKMIDYRKQEVVKTYE